jgi:hypothetical protein
MLNVITLNVDMLSIIMLSVVAPNNLVCNLKICMLCTDGTPCFDTAVSYARNMFMKSTTGVNFISFFVRNLRWGQINWCSSLTLLTSIRKGWQGLPRTNTQAYLNC